MAKVRGFMGDYEVGTRDAMQKAKLGRRGTDSNPEGELGAGMQLIREVRHGCT